jgi:hypothetical protein
MRKLLVSNFTLPSIAFIVDFFEMDRLSRFLPSFGDSQTASVTPSTELSTNSNGGSQDELLGLQRIMADAQNPKRPVIGMAFFPLLLMLIQYQLEQVHG